MMIIRNAGNGETLKVHDLNQIAVLLDRSETALTEIGVNTWPGGIVGPPHSHAQKEQLFLIVTGTGRVVAGDRTFQVKPGNLIYIPPGVQHQTIADPGAPVSYLLVNAFLDSSKEGHGSFAEHIDKVKDERKAQAAGLAGSHAIPVADKAPALASLTPSGCHEPCTYSAAVLMDRSKTARSEAVLCSLPVGYSLPLTAHPDREQAVYVLQGSGDVTVKGESGQVEPGDLAYIPLCAPHRVQAGACGLRYVIFNTFLDATQGATETC